MVLLTTESIGPAKPKQLQTKTKTSHICRCVVLLKWWILLWNMLLLIYIFFSGQSAKSKGLSTF